MSFAPILTKRFYLHDWRGAEPDGNGTVHSSYAETLKTIFDRVDTVVTFHVDTLTSRNIPRPNLETRVANTMRLVTETAQSLRNPLEFCAELLAEVSKLNIAARTKNATPPAANEDALAAKKDAPAAKEDAPAAKEDAPAKTENAPAATEDDPGEDDTPTGGEATPVREHDKHASECIMVTLPEATNIASVLFVLSNELSAVHAGFSILEVHANAAGDLLVLTENR